jgi:hypothetical protein
MTPRVMIYLCALALAIVVGTATGCTSQSAGSGAKACTWPIHAKGTASETQLNLVRCYLKAVAERSSAELLPLAVNNNSNNRITSRDLSYSKAANSGTATAIFTPNAVDPTYVKLTIEFASGARIETGIYNMIAFGQNAAWRIAIGSNWDS